MVSIICDKGQREAILNWMLAKDEEMFADVDRCGFDPKANGHPGIFTFLVSEEGLTADSGRDEFFYTGHTMCWELKQFYVSLKKAFPEIGFSGTVSVIDKYPEAFYVESKPGKKKINITELDPWD